MELINKLLGFIHVRSTLAVYLVVACGRKKLRNARKYYIVQPNSQCNSLDFGAVILTPYRYRIIH